MPTDFKLPWRQCKENGRCWIENAVGEVVVFDEGISGTEVADLIVAAVNAPPAGKLAEALREMTHLAEGPTGGVTVAMKRAVIDKARAALAEFDAQAGK